MIYTIQDGTIFDKEKRAICINIEDIESHYKINNLNSDNKKPYHLYCLMKNKERICFYSDNETIRDKIFNEIRLLREQINMKEAETLYIEPTGGELTTKEEFKPMEILKNYFNKHQESIISLAFLLLLDEFIFEGQFRGRIKSIVENIFNKNEQKLLKKED